MLKRAWTFMIFLSLSGALPGQSTASSTVSATIVKIVGFEENDPGENLLFASRIETNLVANPLATGSMLRNQNYPVTIDRQIASVKLLSNDYSFGVTQIADISMQNAVGETMIVENIGVSITRSPGLAGNSSFIKICGTFKLSAQTAGHYEPSQPVDVIISFE